MRVSAEELDLEPPMYIHERSELMSQLRNQLAMLPELEDLTPQCDISTADVGVSGKSPPEEKRNLRSILEYHSKIFLGDRNAAPAPAHGVICDVDVGDAQPIAVRPRSVGPHILPKVYELLKKLLETNLIEHSESPRASPIVIVLKKNGIDIRILPDREWFSETLVFPLPLINDLLLGFENALWFTSLNMASGFWAVKTSERAKLISAFVCPFGHFQWNAPLMYQGMINNCLWGFVRLSPEEEADFDRWALFSERAPISTTSLMVPRLWISSMMTSMNCSSDCVARIFHLLKNEFGKLVIPYLSHEISTEEISAVPKIAKGVQDLPFPTTLKEKNGSVPDETFSGRKKLLKS
ncbi:LOW QUALITY PROTEIN: reverse transcriptase [Phytophthora megakarya]|uniref:Reverse transcriptase n=1 Tax=Phytophthora megakarya TaxID=4795 RepID=A0A225WES2_9STRA|nr:LOW QUALITY PROTEIN: reverse transcriptase [Phytophthora megakarya]